ncbi:hypothetical protein ACH5RR_005541 [Cinchona calisaya]|uniref:Beta-galactosidase n=1 Tax=Cinchona calisaya TaxID=153742 RepID=A0ABD3ALG4_9GENT
MECHRMFFVFSIIWFASYLNCQSTEVSYDGRALKIDGERKIINSGSIHYPRSTTEMWPSLIKNAKDGGLDAIETYVFWNAHEPHRREDEVKIFTTLIVDMMKKEKLFASQGGPIILAQIENEFGDVANKFGNDAKPYLNWNVKFAESLNIGVPWIMCQQADAPEPIIHTCNGYYCDGFNQSSKTIPKIWTENWTGWFKDWGSPDPHRTAEDVAFAVARFFQFEGTVQNYYMYHGGTNFGRTSGGPYITTTYDYDAPLNEYGLVNQPKWGHLKQLHLLLKSMEKILTYGDKSDHQYEEYGKWQMSATIYDYNGSRVCFFGNADKDRDLRITFEGRNYTVPAWSVSVLPDCETVVYNTAHVHTQTNVLDKVNSVTSLEWQWRVEPIQHISQKHHTKPPKGVTFATELLDQKTVTNDTSDYLWYMTTVDLDESDPIWGREVTLKLHTTGHIIHAFFNRKHIGSKYAQNGHFEFDFEAIGKVKHGTNTITLLSATVGLQNYGAHYDHISNGILGPIKLVAPNNEEMDLSKNKWGYKVGLNGIEERQLFLDTEHRKWRGPENLPVNRMFIWYKTSFDTPSADEPVVLNLEDMGKGTAWVNGNNIGRYWTSYFSDKNGCDSKCDYHGSYYSSKCQTNCGTPSQKWYHIPRSFLNKDGKNNLVLFEEFGGNPENVRVQTVSLVKICAFAEEGNTTLDLSCQGKTMTHINFASFGNPTGVCGAFNKGNFDSPNSVSAIQDACIGKESCSIDLSTKTFKAALNCGSEKRRLAIEILCN